jgi:hypothetical protein
MYKYLALSFTLFFIVLAISVKADFYTWTAGYIVNPDENISVPVGYVIHATSNLQIYQMGLADGTTATEVSVYDIDGNLLGTANITGLVATFNPKITITNGNDYRVVAHSNGSLYTRTYAEAFYPYNWDYFNVIGATYFNETWQDYFDPYDVYNIQNITIETVGINHPTSINLWLNGNENNTTIIYGATLNSTVAINVTGLWVVIEKNGTLITNVTTSTFDVTQWGAGYYNLTAYYSGNATYLGSSASYYVNITKSDTPLTLSNNISWSGTYPVSSNTAGSGCPTQLTCYLYRNYTLVNNPDLVSLGAGVHNYIYNTTGNENYSANSTSNVLTISKAASSCSLTGIDNHTYGSTDTVACSCTGEGTTHLYQNGTQHNEWNNTPIIYEARTYNWVCNITQSENYTSDSMSRIQTINVTNTTMGTYTNNSVSTIANITTSINATTTSNTPIILDIVTTSNVTNSSISITEYNTTPPNATIIGIYGMNMFFSINTGSALNTSLSWVMMNISYNESEAAANGLDEASLRLYRYNVTSDSWAEVSPSGVNINNNYVWGNLTGFSFYGLGGLMANDQSCSADSNCYSSHCIHGICRSTSSYCGDAYCDSGETNVNCPRDCSSAALTGGGGGAPLKTKCTYNWTCTEWSECLNGVQTRTCTNGGTCKDNVGKPIESQSCSMPSTPENITPIAPEANIIPPTNATSPTPTATTPLGLGIGLIAVVIISFILIFVILKKRKGKKNKILK